MKRIHLLIAALLLSTMPALAQSVVIDPSQIAASAINVADQIDYAIDQIGELMEMGDKLGNLKGHLDNVFGEDGVGGKAISLMQDLGTLERLTKVFNSTIDASARYASRIGQSGDIHVSDANVLLSYLNSSKQTATLAVATAKKILESIGLSKGEKKAELDRMVEELEKNLRKMDKVMEIEVDSSMMAQGMSDFVRMVDGESSSERYVEALQDYGEKKSTAGRALGVVSILLMLLGLLSAAYGYVIFTRGGIAGDPTAQNIFIRIGVALVAATVVINVLARTFHLTL